jgi:membrane-associated phospholipid phosphatase
VLTDGVDHKHRAPGIVILVVYLLATLVLVPRQLAVQGVTHVTLLAIGVWRLRRSRETAFDLWLPLAAIPFLYAELPTLMIGPVHDALIRGWETRLFGVSPAATLAGRFSNVWLSELLHLGYLSYYPIIYVPPLLLHLSGKRRELAATVGGLMATYAICFVVFALFPVEGPRYEWGSPAGIVEGPVRRLTLALLGAGASRGAAFPSSHVSVAVAQTIMAFRWQPRTAPLLAASTGLLALGAVYGGFHYGVDAIAGGMLGLTTGVAATRLFARSGGKASMPLIASCDNAS